MSEEFCPECGAKITGKTGFCSECGAVTTSLNNQIKESKEIERIGNIQKWYHKPDKSHMMALIYSILLPFSGNLYLRENIINLVLTVISIIFIFANIIGVLTVSDFYYRNGHLFIVYAIWWIISILSLLYFIVQYNKRDIYFKKDDEKYSQETQLPNLFNKEYLKYIPFVIVILFLIVNMGVMFSDSPKTFDAGDFSFNYPHDYTSRGTLTYNQYASEYQGSVGDYPNTIDIRMFPASYSIKEYVDEVYHFRYSDGSGHDNINKGKTNVDDSQAYIIQDKDKEWTNVMFVRDGNLYQIIFNGDSQNDMDTIIDSFKFK